MDEKSYFKCCLCGKDVSNDWEHNNPEPFGTISKNGDFCVCCDACNNEFVKPCRKVLWPLDYKEYSKIVPYVRKMTLSELRGALLQDDPLSAFKSFRRERRKQERRARWHKRLPFIYKA